MSIGERTSSLWRDFERASRVLAALDIDLADGNVKATLAHIIVKAPIDNVGSSRESHAAIANLMQADVSKYAGMARAKARDDLRTAAYALVDSLQNDIKAVERAIAGTAAAAS